MWPYILYQWVNHVYVHVMKCATQCVYLLICMCVCIYTYDGSSCAHIHLLVVECLTFYLTCLEKKEVGEQDKSFDHPSLDSLHSFEVPISLLLGGNPMSDQFFKTASWIFLTTLICGNKNTQLWIVVGRTHTKTISCLKRDKCVLTIHFRKI